MLNQFKKNSLSKYRTLLLFLITTLHCQEVNNSEYSLVLAPDISNQWWSKYNNYGQEQSEVYLNYWTNYSHKNTNINLKIFAAQNKIYIGESFVWSKLFKNTYIKAGKYYKDFSSYLNDNLSSGSLLVSNNAQPMPKVGIISSYKFKERQHFDFNFGIAHGLLSESILYKTAPMLHEKFIYLNYFKDKNEFSIGFVHEAIWGGSTEDYGDFPDSFKDFLKVFISADGPLLNKEPHANALGNHLGIWDFYYKRSINNKELKLYYQHLFEDTSGLRFANKSDGLWGIELSNFIQNTDILIEYLNTMNQDRRPPYVNENYYNHSQYKEGWSYKGYVLGNPFIDSSNNNPLKALHLGIKNNKINDFNYKFLLSRNIHESDTVKYQIILGKKINNFLTDIIISGENSNSVSIRLSYQL